jgi:surfeit locus 1 family protein
MNDEQHGVALFQPQPLGTQRFFMPSIKLTLVLLVLALIFARLGWWQTERKSEKQLLFDQFRDAPVLGIEDALSQGALFARIEASGRYDPERHVLLDNKILGGRTGVHVLTPFNLPDGREILVNRGWLPLSPDRRSLPAVNTGGAPRTISGILNKPSEGGPRIGDADVLVRDRWPQLVTYLELDAVSEALGVSLEPWLLQLDQGDSSGFEDRQWKAAVMGPEVHGAYAVQWFSLSLATLIIWITLGVRRAKARPDRATKGESK